MSSTIQQLDLLIYQGIIPSRRWQELSIKVIIALVWLNLPGMEMKSNIRELAILIEILQEAQRVVDKLDR
jgi:hypothetical protein